MAFEGGCYGSVQIHNKRYLAVMLEADEVAAGGAAMALCGGQTRNPGLMDVLNLRQAQGLMPNFDSINLRVCPISSAASLLAGASPSVPPRQQQLLQQKQLQRAQGSGEAAMEAVSQPVVRPLRMIDNPANMTVAEKKARRAARKQVVLQQQERQQHRQEELRVLQKEVRGLEQQQQQQQQHQQQGKGQQDREREARLREQNRRRE
ncbi:unnamed protein product, partial [Ectocarpus sp. 12 AP-2014]